MLLLASSNLLLVALEDAFAWNMDNMVVKIMNPNAVSWARIPSLPLSSSAKWGSDVFLAGLLPSLNMKRAGAAIVGCWAVP